MSASSTSVPTNQSSAPAKPWPEGGLEPVPACPVCAGTARELIHDGLTDRVFRCAPGEWNLHRCAACGTGYLDPRPNTETIGLAYSSYFTHGSNRTPAETSAWRRFKRAQRNGYLNAQYGYQLEPAISGSLLWLTSERRQRFDRDAGFMPFPGKGARLLDVGCGNGNFLSAMRAAGWDVSGVEPDPKSAAQAVAAGLKVQVGWVETASFTENSFDAITLKHVIEHLHDPIRTLRRCLQILKPGGRIAIATPNLDSFGHRQFGRDWFALDPPRHLIVFTPDSLRRALQAAGFEPEPLVLRQVSKVIFRRSMHVAIGSDPMNNKPKLPLGLRLKADWLAFQADRATLRRRELTEELVMLGRRVR